jgi:glutathione peroxidase
MYRSRGLEIIAFPCSNFLNQEPGTNADVKSYVESIDVQFTVMGKLECENGAKTHPLFKFLKQRVSGGGLGRRLMWNYVKFLVDAEGVPVKRIGSMDSALSLEPDIEALLVKG